MTGRNRNERLSDAQRSALWDLGRGYTLHEWCGGGIHRFTLGPPGSTSLLSSLPLRTNVAIALARRRLVRAGRPIGIEMRYELTDRGREVAAEIVAANEATV